MNAEPESPTRAPALNVAVLTRTRRPSGAYLARAVGHSRHRLRGVLAERRSSLVRRLLRRESGRSIRSLFGVEFLRSRIAGDGGILPPVDAADAAADAGAAYVETASLNAPGSVDLLQSWNVDVLIVANAPVLQSAVFESCRIAALNFHSGRLPEYGGLESEFWALYDGQPEAWVTLHRIAAELDSGAILDERAVPIATDESPASLHAKCIACGAEMLPALLDRLSERGAEPLRDPGPAQLRPWPTNAQRRELRTRR